MSTLARLNGAANQDNTFATLMGDYQTPAYASVLAILTKQTSAKTVIKPATLTGNVSITVNVGDNTADDVAPYIGDELEFLFHADGSDRTVTFSTGFAGSSSLIVSGSGYSFAAFKFNGLNWVIANSSSFQGPSTDVQTPAYGASIAVTTTGRNTVVKPGTLTGALTLTAVLTNAIAGDRITFIFTADSTARIVTFSTNITAAGTLRVPASASATASFIYNGTTWLQVSVDEPRALVDDVQTPVYGASIAITTTKKNTKVIVGQLTGALTLTAVLTNALAGDTLAILFGTDGTQRVVTFSTGLASVGTLTIPASKFGSTSFCYDGTEWVETGRAITA